VITGPTWPAVVLALINAIQLVALAYVAVQQSRASDERKRRVELEDQVRHQGPPPH
jgi:hypothetical protein